MSGIAKTIKYNPNGNLVNLIMVVGFLTGNAGEGERNAVAIRLTPQAANIIAVGTQQQASQSSSMAIIAIGSNTQQFNFATAYANAKTKVSHNIK